jgi:hypothetical protein
VGRWPFFVPAEPQGEAMTESALRQALERVTANFRLMLAGKPVRDVSETLAECEAALAAPVEQQVHADLLREALQEAECALSLMVSYGHCDGDETGRDAAQMRAVKALPRIAAALGLPVVQPAKEQG